jgi:hypothetical protein
MSLELVFRGRCGFRLTPPGDRLPGGNIEPENVYVCKVCQKVIKPNTPSYLLPVRIRQKKYPFRASANEYIDHRTGRRKKSDDPGGLGQEIASEIRVCRCCYNKADTAQLE